MTFVAYRGRRRARRVGEGPAGRRAARTVAEQLRAKLALGDLSLFEDPPATSIQITMDVYGHLLPGTFARLVDALDNATGCNPAATGRQESARLSNADR